MAVIGVPIVGSDPTAFLDPKSAWNAPQLFGEDVTLRKRAVQLTQGGENTLLYRLYHEDGSVVTLESDSNIKARVAEAILSETSLAEITPAAVDTDNYVITLEFPASIQADSGIYLVSVGFFNDLDKLIFTSDFFVYNEPSMWGTTSGNALPKIKDIQLSMRDSDIVENELTGSRQFGVEEITLAAINTINLWNDTPPVTVGVTTKNFTYPTIWRLGIQYYLYDMILEWYRKNRLQYNAGGISVDDMNRLNEYTAAQQQRQRELILTIKQNKSTIVLNRGFSKIG